MLDVQHMRTTLTIDDDVLDTAKQVAAARGISIGEMISELARKGLTAKADAAIRTRNGIRLFPVQPESGSVTSDIVSALLDEPG